jgi:hypothetical protein
MGGVCPACHGQLGEGLVVHRLRLRVRPPGRPGPWPAVSALRLRRLGKRLDDGPRTSGRGSMTGFVLRERPLQPLQSAGNGSMAGAASGRFGGRRCSGALLRDRRVSGGRLTPAGAPAGASSGACPRLRSAVTVDEGGFPVVPARNRQHGGDAPAVDVDGQAHGRAQGGDERFLVRFVEFPLQRLQGRGALVLREEGQQSAQLGEISLLFIGYSTSISSAYRNIIYKKPPAGQARAAPAPDAAAAGATFTRYERAAPERTEKELPLPSSVTNCSRSTPAPRPPGRKTAAPGARTGRPSGCAGRCPEWRCRAAGSASPVWSRARPPPGREKSGIDAHIFRRSHDSDHAII